VRTRVTVVPCSWILETSLRERFNSRGLRRGDQLTARYVAVRNVTGW